jgi:hypothetical protein
MTAINKYHRFLSAKQILARKDGWKTLLPVHCADLMLSYEASLGSGDVLSKLEADYGKKIATVIVDLARTHVENPKMNDVLINAMLKAA